MNRELEARIHQTAQEFARLTGQPCYFLPCTGVDDFSPDLVQGSCPDFCFEIAGSHVGSYLCRMKRRALVGAAVERKEPAVAICHAGLYEIMAPAFSGGELVGLFNACFAPIKLAENVRAQIDLYQTKYGVAGDVLIGALNQIAPIGENTITSVKDLLNALITIFASSTEGNTPWSDSSGLSDDEDGDEEDSVPRPLLSRPFSLSLELMKNAEGGYQSADDVLQTRINQIFADIRTGKLVRAKESFKAMMNSAYLEEDIERQRFAIQFLVFRMDDNFLRKLSYYDEVYRLAVSITTRIGAARSTRDVREIASAYFDGMTEIFRMKDQNRYAIINRIVDFVNENYARPFTIKDMAKTQNVSTSYASRTFSEQMGTSIKEYINEIRMYHAQYLLRSTDWPVSVVAERVGYPDVRSFYKMFEKHFGIPCSHLRRLFAATPAQKREEPK